MPNDAGDAGADPAMDVAASSPAGQAADVLLDRVQLGLDVALHTKATPAAAAKFCKALVRAGLLAREPQTGAALDEKLQVGPARVRLPDGASVSLAGQLALVSDRAGQLRVSRSSHLLPDPMRALRSLLPSPLAVGAGGEDNLAAAYEPDAYRELLPLQLRAVAEAVDAFVAALAKAASVSPRLLHGRVWVQQAEFCRDYPYPSEEGEEGAAEAYVRRLRDRPIRGGRHERGRYFAEQQDNKLTVSWHEGTKTAPERKVYAKLPDLVRVEVSLRRRGAVAALQKRLGAPRSGSSLSGSAAAAELALLAHGAETLLEEAVAALDEGLVAVPRAGADFLLAFVPLLRLAAPEPREAGAAGRPHRADVQPLARQALERLLAEGKFDMRRVSPSHKVLLALREMQAAGALAVEPRLPRLFAVAPELEAARQALAGVGTQPLGGSDAG